MKYTYHRLIFIFIIFIFITESYSNNRDEKISLFANPNSNAIYSLLIPGTGQLINGQNMQGIKYLGSGSLLHGLHYYLVNHEDNLWGDDKFDDENKIKFINRPSHWGTTSFRAVLNLHFYSAFAAYRDARQFFDIDYTTPAPSENLKDIILAPFNLEYATKWTSLIPIAIVSGIMAIDYDNLYESRWIHSMSGAEVFTASLISGSFSAYGEEAFFRGYLNNEFSHRFGSIAGIALSSTLFAMTHGLGGNNASILSAGLFGIYLGWLQQQNDYKINEGVFIHFWINFIGAAMAINKGGPVDKNSANPFYFSVPIINISF